MSYTTVFDVTQSGFRHWWFPAAGLVFIVVGAVMFVFGRSRVFASFVLLFACFWTLASFALTASDYFRLASALRHGRCEVVEGVVTEFEPWSDVIKKDETFVVNGHRFHYSDFIIMPGFNNTQVHGGPIHDGLQVRIHYTGNDIAKLEIARSQK